MILTWPPEQWMLALGFTTSVIAALTTMAVKIINAVKGIETQVEALEVKVDGRLSQLLAQTALASRAEGVVAGRGEIVTPIPAGLGPHEGVVTLPEPAGGHLIVPIPKEPPPIVLVPTDGDVTRDG